MGAADVIPGVSGGTIALITDIYEELIDSIKSIGSKNIFLLFKNNGIRRFIEATNAYFLLSVLLGIAISLLSLSHLMQFLLANYPIYIWSFFFGLILASAWFVGKTISKWNTYTVINLIIGIAAGFWVTTITPAETTANSWFIFICGAIAVCAMILPGISGSFILLLLGKYAYMMGALTSLNIGIIAIFAAGALIGIILFSKVLSFLLHRFHAQTIAILTGFMIGSLNKIWPWKVSIQTFIDAHGIIKPLVEKNVLPNTFLYENSTEPHTIMAILFALIGIALVVILEHINVSKVDEEEDLRKKLGF